MAIANWTCVSWVAYAPGTIPVNVTWIERQFNACQMPRSMYPFLRYSSGGSRGRPPIDMTNFCINVKSHLRMHQNPPFSGKKFFFFCGGGTAPSADPYTRPSAPIIKFWIRHWDIALYRWRVTGFQQYSWASEWAFLTTFCFPLGTPLGQSR